VGIILILEMNNKMATTAIGMNALIKPYVIPPTAIKYEAIAGIGIYKNTGHKRLTLCTFTFTFFQIHP
jgi:hypothetical protein